MTHTSTEQPELLMKLADDYAEACFDQGLHKRTTDDKPEAAREKLEKELRRLHARVQELEAQTAHMADLVELADYATKKLEAAQAQRAPLTQKQRKQLVCSYFAEPWAMEKADAMLHELERSLCITQEKQG